MTVRRQIENKLQEFRNSGQEPDSIEVGPGIYAQLMEETAYHSGIVAAPIIFEGQKAPIINERTPVEFIQGVPVIRVANGREDYFNIKAKSES